MTFDALCGLMQARKKIGSFEHECLRDFVYKRVLFDEVSAISAMIYLTAETIGAY